MRTITPAAFTVYSFTELDEKTQEKAVEVIAGKLGSDWWDETDNDDIRDVMIWTLAQQLGTPDHDKWGVNDYPGIHGVTVEGWDLDRAQSFILRGRLDESTAPNLPWPAGLDEIQIEDARDHNRFTCVSDTLTCEQVDEIGAQTVQKLREAIHEAWRAGEQEADYKSSADRAREWIEDNDPEFTADGDLYR